MKSLDKQQVARRREIGDGLYPIGRRFGRLEVVQNQDRREPMTRLAMILLAVMLTPSMDAAQPRAEWSPRRCAVAGDVVLCHQEPFIVDAYSDAETASANFHQLVGTDAFAPVYFLTTGDQTRRALVVHLWDYNKGPLPNGIHDGYVAELYSPFERDTLDKRERQLSYDQRAGSFELPLDQRVLGGGWLLIFRTFDNPTTPHAK